MSQAPVGSIADLRTGGSWFDARDAELHSSVGSAQDLRTGGRWFDFRLDQYYFRGLMIVIATGLIPFSSLSVVSTMVMWESSQWPGKITEHVLFKVLQEIMDRCTGRLDITEILLKTTY